MTLIAIWANKPEDPTSIMLATDSRLSNSDQHWDRGTKIFRLGLSHQYFAFCGTALPALCAIQQSAVLLATSNVLSQAILSDSKDAILSYATMVSKHLSINMRSFPKAWGSDATVICCGYCSRQNRFEIYKIVLPIADPMPELVPLLFEKCRFYAFGSGKHEFELQASNAKNSSDFYRAFLQVILEGKVSSVGGPPQIVSIGIKRSKLIGVNWNFPSGGGGTVSTVLGQELNSKHSLDSVDFRDMNFIRDRYLNSAQISRSGRPLKATKKENGITYLAVDNGKSAKRRRRTTGRKPST